MTSDRPTHIFDPAKVRDQAPAGEAGEGATRWPDTDPTARGMTALFNPPRKDQAPKGYSTAEAVAMAQHIKAALLHLRQAEDLAEAAGIDLDGYMADTEPGGLFHAASEALQELDVWAIGSAREHGAAPAETYQHTERWCHAPGGQLPAASWLETVSRARPVDGADLAEGMTVLYSGHQSGTITAIGAPTYPPQRPAGLRNATVTGVRGSEGDVMTAFYLGTTYRVTDRINERPES